MVEILALILSHTEVNIRKLACSIFAAAVQNNGEVQKFSARLGALNLTQLCATEQNLQLREALFTALSNFLKADNFEGKRLFIRDFDGLQFVTNFVVAENNLKFSKKVLTLLNDLVMNDD